MTATAHDIHTYDTRSFETGHISLSTLKQGFTLFRFDNDKERLIVASFIASQHAMLDGESDDELYVESYDWLLSEG